jgi:hypothetical protein
LTAVDAVGNDGSGTDDGRRTGDGRADDTSASGTSRSKRHVRLLR